MGAGHFVGGGLFDAECLAILQSLFDHDYFPRIAFRTSSITAMHFGLKIS